MKTLNYFVAILITTFTLTACGSASNPEGGAALNGGEEGSPGLSQAAIDDMNFDNSFSPYVGVSADKQYLRINFGFFPDGTTYNTAKSGEKVFVTFNDAGSTETVAVEGERENCGSYCVVIPLDFIAPQIEGLSLGVSAPENGSHAESIKYEFNAANENFTVDGYIVPADFSKFADQFGFVITADGFKDVETGHMITGEKLEDIYQKIILTADVD